MVLLVEDNPADVFLVEEALRLHDLAVQLLVLEDGEKAIRWLQASGATKDVPDAVVLDLNLPKRSGADVLALIRSTGGLKETPVILFTSSNSHRDRGLGERYSRTLYLRKSPDFNEFMNIGAVLKQVLEEGAVRTNPD